MGGGRGSGKLGGGRGSGKWTEILTVLFSRTLFSGVFPKLTLLRKPTKLSISASRSPA